MRTARSFGSIDRALVALAGVSGTILAILWWGTVIVLGQPRLQGFSYLLVILGRPAWLLGQTDAPDRFLFGLLHYYMPAVLLVFFTIGLWQVLRPGGMTVPAQPVPFKNYDRRSSAAADDRARAPEAAGVS